MSQIVHNRVRCLYCGDVIESKDYYAETECKCGKIKITGGLYALKRIGVREGHDYAELSKFLFND